jgi:hypothetical protein
MAIPCYSQSSVLKFNPAFCTLHSAFCTSSKTFLPKITATWHRACTNSGRLACRHGTMRVVQVEPLL